MPTALDGVLRVELEPIRDDRGFFARAWCANEFEAAGAGVSWVQANLARNPVQGTLRGLHFQREPDAEAKLVRCTKGSVYDVALDLREQSDTYGHWVREELSADGGEMLFIPAGFAHGYVTLEPETDVFYFTSVAYQPDAADGVRYDDPRFAIDWGTPIALVSPQDGSWPYVQTNSRA
jgi:dTDP-4-dehydrorhamnose 3,5-epimerase